jgi:hypothetical protein
MTVIAGQVPAYLNFVAEVHCIPDLSGGASTSSAQDTGKSQTISLVVVALFRF